MYTEKKSLVQNCSETYKTQIQSHNQVESVVEGLRHRSHDASRLNLFVFNTFQLIDSTTKMF